MGRRQRIVIGAGFAVLLAVAAVGVRASRHDDGYPTGWEEQAIGEMALSIDRRTLWIGAEEYLSASCHDGRAEVDPGEERWTVTLEARQTQEMCTLEGCILDGAPGGRARILDPGEVMPCALVSVQLDRRVPEGVEVVPAS